MARKYCNARCLNWDSCDKLGILNYMIINTMVPEQFMKEIKCIERCQNLEFLPLQNIEGEPPED